MYTLIEFIQSSSFYKKIKSKWKHQIYYQIASQHDLKKYSKWIFNKNEKIEDVINLKRTYIIAIHRKRIIGSVMLQQKEIAGSDDMFIVLYSLKVKLLYRKMAIGTTLTQKAIEWAKNKHYSELFLSTGIDNLQAQMLYLKTGFKSVEYNDLPNHYKNEIDAYKNQIMFAFIFIIKS